MINVLKLTMQNLKNGKYKNGLPELYSLISYVENNASHNHESVFDHTIKVFGNMKKTLKNVKNARTKKRMDEKIGKRTKIEQKFSFWI